MAALGIGLIWIGYTAGLYGYCLFRGYDITPKQLMSSAWPPGGTPAAKQGSGNKPAGTAVPGAITQNT